MRKEERVGESVTVKGNVLEIFLFNFFFGLSHTVYSVYSRTGVRMEMPVWTF